MALYVLASVILGWQGMSCAAQATLRARGYGALLGHAQRLLIVLVCMTGAACAWLLFDNAVACLAFSFACACMGALIVCDLREHVLPTELVAVMLVLGMVFRVAVDGMAAMLAVGAPAASVAALLLALNWLRTRRGAAEVVGSGDVRMIVPLALFSGGSGLMCGVFACCVLMGMLALAQVLVKRKDRHSTIALAPGLAAWLIVGTLAPIASF